MTEQEGRSDKIPGGLVIGNASNLKEAITGSRIKAPQVPGRLIAVSSGSEPAIFRINPEQRIPLTSWISAPEEALTRLATETRNNRVLSILQAVEIQQKLLDTELSAIGDEEPVDQRDAVRSSALNRYVGRLSQRDYTESERERIASIDSSFPVTMSDSEVKLALPDEIADEFPKEEYSTEEKGEIGEQMDSFLKNTLEDTRSLFGTEHQEKILNSLTTLVDAVRFQTKTIQLEANQTVEAIAEIAQTADIVDSNLLDFLTRFEIPPSLAGELLLKIDQAGQLTHPVAWYLLDTLSYDHPFKQEQQHRVDRLTDLLTGEISEADLQEAIQLRDHVVSVFVDPNSDPTGDKVGLEFESMPVVDAVTVPTGTVMGQDVDELADSIPELRLDQKDDVLFYGRKWRERYYQIHLWQQLTQATGGSLNIHINANPQTRLDAYKMLFGLEDEQVRRNAIGTIELRRIPFLGNTDISGSRVFASEHMPELVELMYSLRDREPTQIDSSMLQTDRFTFFTEVIHDPVSRAAMLLAMKTDAGQRVRDPRDLLAQIESNDAPTIVELGRSIGSLDVSLQRRVVERAIETLNQKAIIELGKNLGLLDVTVQRRYRDWAIESRHQNALSEMGKSIGSLDASLHERVVTAALEIRNMSLDSSLGAHIGSISLPLQERYVGRIIERRNGNALRALGEGIRLLDPSLHEGVVTAAIETQNENALHALAARIESLDFTLQRRVVEAAIELQSDLALLALGHKMEALDISLRERYISWTIESRNKYAIKGLARGVGSLAPTVQEQLVPIAIETRNRDTLWTLGRNVGSLDVTLQEQVITAAIETGNENALSALSQEIGSLDVSLHERVVTTAIDTRNELLILTLAKEIGSLSPSLQERIVAASIETENIVEINVNSLHDTLRLNFLEYLRENYPIRYKAQACNSEGWVYEDAA